MRRPLQITKTCYDRIIRWALTSKNEVNGLCYGKDRTITHVYRLRNIEKFPRYACNLNPSEVRHIKSLVPANLRKIAEFHSHPNTKNSRPSKTDCFYLPKGHIEIIYGTKSKGVNAWRIQNTWKQTIKTGEIPLIIIKEKP